MDELKKNIELAEEKWLNKVFLFLEEEFLKSPLPSHDHHHHLRVWKHARFMLEQFPSVQVIPGYGFTESLLLSSMFHDSGMIRTLDADHGKESRKICETFLKQTGLEPLQLNQILDAIERHDDKSYSGAGPLFTSGKPNLLTGLGIADDLDAFGYIGIYRYCEIYLMRGIPPEDLGLKIIANLAGRFSHFMVNCKGLDRMIISHIPRYKIIEDFFRYYNLQIRKMDEEGVNPEKGPVSVIRQIYRYSLMGHNGISEICSSALQSETDPYSRNFFEKLQLELIQS